MTSLPLISVVDDDYSVRESLQRLIRSVGFAVKVFASAEEFWNSECIDEAGCVILDIRMSGINGIELWNRLRTRDRDIPVIFITAHGSEAQRCQVLSEGAVDYLYKPFSEDTLLRAIRTALELEVVRAKSS